MGRSRQARKLAAHRARKQARRAEATLRLEALEERIVPAVDTLSTAAVLAPASNSTLRVAGFIEAHNDVELFKLTLTQGEVVRLDVAAAELGSSLDSYLRVFDAAGLELFANDNFDGRDARLTFQAPASGTYYVGISAAGNDAYDPAQALPLSTGALLGQTHGLFDLTVIRQTAALAPDLIGAAFQLHSDSAAVGDTVSLSYRVENRGAAAAGSFTIDLYLSSDNQFNGSYSQFDAGDTLLTSLSVSGGLAAATARAGQLELTLPAFALGTGYLGMVISPAAGAANTLNNGNLARGNDWDRLEIIRVAAVGFEGTQAAPVFLPLNARTEVVPLAAGQEQYFTLNIGQAGLVELRVAGSGVDTSLTLLDASGAPLIASAALPALRQHLDAGTYLVRVAGLAGSGTFVLRNLYQATATEELDTLDAGELPRTVATGDFNGDGIVDVVSASDGTPLFTVFRGLGDGTFAPGNTQASPTGDKIVRLNVADFNNDGRSDLVIVDASNQLQVLLAAGNSLVAAGPTLAFAGSAAAATGDFNSDGLLDLVVGVADDGGQPGRFYAYLGNGDGTFVLQDLDADAAQTGLLVTGLSDWPLHQLAVGDFNGDGRLDVTSNGNADMPGSLAPLFLGQGNGRFVQAGTRLTGAAGAVTVRDFDRDGHLDLAENQLFFGFVSGQVQLGRFTLALGLGDGTFAAPLAFPTRLFGKTLAAGDLNGDGVYDLVLNDKEQLAVVLGSIGAGGFTFQPDRLMPIPVTGLGNTLLADLDGDGRIDVVVGGREFRHIDLLFGRGDGTLHTLNRAMTGGFAASIVAADFNNDFRTDLATSNLANQELVALISNGDGSFGDPRRYLVGPNARVLIDGDFNGDGRKDLAIYHHVNGIPGFDPEGKIRFGRLDFFLGLGDGTFQFAREIEVFADDVNGPVYLNAADLNGDGRDDVVINQEVFVLGPNLTTQATALLPGLARTIGYFNDDLLPDLLVEQGSTSAVYLGQGDGTFAANGAVIAATNLKVGSFNGDDHRDLVALDNPLEIFFGNGEGTFGPAVTVPLPATYFAHTVGDFNDDGLEDIALATRTGQVLALRSNGDGTFATFQLDLGVRVSTLIAADPDGDGRLDLALTQESGKVIVLLGLGDGSFIDAARQSSRTPRDTPLTADFNSDGTLDIIALSANGDVLYRQGRPGAAGEFLPPVLVNPLRSARDVAIILDQGGARLATIDIETDQVSIYQFTPSGFTRTAGPPTGLLPARLAVGDLNGDGWSDLVVLNAGTGDLSVFLGGPGGFAAGSTLQPGAGPLGLTLADVDGASGLDILIANEVSGDVSVFLNAGAGSFGPPQVFRAGTGRFGNDGSDVQSQQGTAQMVVGLFDGDATPEVVTINRQANTFALLAGHAGNTFANPVVFQAGSLPSGLVAGDFNRDGKLDIAMLNSGDNTISVYLNDGAGQFALSARVDAGNVPTGLSSFDVNDDGRLDLLIGNSFGDVLFVLGNGDGTFRPFVRVTQNVPFVTTDINGDGAADVVLANQSVDQVLSQIRQAGTSSFSLGSFAQGRGQGVQAPGFLTLADVNGDGRDDLLVANSGSNNVLVYLGTAPGQFSTTARSFFAGTNPVSLAVLDLNADGRQDVAVANQGSNDVSVLLGSGAAGSWTLLPGPRLAVGAGPNHVAAGDFDDDSLIDLMVTNAQQAEMWLLPGTGAGFFNDVNPGVLPLPGNVNQTVFNNGLGFALLNSGSIVTFNPFDFGAAARAVYNSPTTVLTTTFTFLPASSTILAGRGDGSLAVLTEKGGQYADSLIFRDAQLTNPSALRVVGDDLYVTNQGDSMPLVFDLETVTAPGIGGIGPDDLGSTTRLDSVDAAKLSVIATVLGGSANKDDDDAAEDEAADDAFVGNNVGLIGAASLLSLLFAQSGSEETTEEAANEPEVETPEWVEFVIGLQESIDRFRAELRANTPEGEALDAVDGALGQFGLLLADSARGLDGWLTALNPPQRLAARTSVAAPGSQEASDDAEGQQPTVVAASAESVKTVGWWEALTAAVIASCAWLGWRFQLPTRRNDLPGGTPPR